MKPAFITVLVVAIGIVSAFLFLRSRVAESSTLGEFPERLRKLKGSTNPKAFFGFYTRDEDALYFVYQTGTFFLDYELTTPEKSGRAAAFRETAADLGHAVSDTTYGQFPVLRINAGNSEAQAAKVGLAFTQRLFGHNDNTVFEFLP